MMLIMSLTKCKRNQRSFVDAAIYVRQYKDFMTGPKYGVNTDDEHVKFSKICSSVFECFSLNLPLHRAWNPLHVPLAWHVLVLEPFRMNPGSQLNCTWLGYTVESPEEEPFMGTDKGPQSTARNKVDKIRTGVAYFTYIHLMTLFND